MTYSPFLIANYATGLDSEVQPWLLPTDAFVDLSDAYVYRGVTNKRDGYSGFANGLLSTYCESRMVHTITDESYGTGTGITGPYTHTSANVPLRRGTTVITADTQSAQDDGLGVFVTTPAGGTGTIDYTTGAMSITFNAVVSNDVPITVTYDYHQGLPVMGIMSFFPTTNVRQLIVADTTYVNKYNPVTDTLVDISSNTTYNCTPIDFWSWVNYADSSSVPRLLFCNGVAADVIQQWDGTTVSAYSPTFADSTTLNARQIFNFKDRLILFQTYEGGTLFPRRIRISGTGANCDVFDLTASGAGFIDIPDNTWFFGAAFNKDDLMFFTEAGTWSLKYTGNDVVPFILKKIDGSRGSSAAFSVISYLNRTFAASPRGLIISDGNSVQRMDNKIPQFAYNTINPNFFRRCFSGFLDEERDVYLIYPSLSSIRPPLLEPADSDQILINNFEEDNYSVYNIPLSCMGNFQLSLTIEWETLTPANQYSNWDDLAANFGSWQAFPYSTNNPIAIGGGHKGEVWTLNDDQSQDNPQVIRDITIIDENTVQVTTDWNNYNVGDYVFFTGVQGMTQINGQQGAITAIETDYTVFNVNIPTEGFDAYTTAGIASTCIEFSALSKKLNPYVEIDKKVKCGWIYFYVSTADTLLLDSDGNSVPAFLYIDVITNDTQTDSVPSYSYQIDCTGEEGSKKWVKIWINQTSRFLQFRMRNNQAGAKIQVHAMMPGFQPIGRLV